MMASLTPKSRIRDLLAEGSRLAHSGRDYSHALRVLQIAVSAPATRKMIAKQGHHPLIADGYDSLGHVTRELGRSRRWAAEFHMRASHLWSQDGNGNAAALSKLSAAHCLERVATQKAFLLIETIRHDAVYAEDPTIHAQTDNRLAETTALIGNSFGATNIARSRIIPYLLWNEVNPEWAAIASIAAAKFALRTDGPDEAFSVLEFVRDSFVNGVAANDVILTDLLGVEIAMFLAAGEVSAVENAFRQMSLLSARNGYTLTEHLEVGVLGQFGVI